MRTSRLKTGCAAAVLGISLVLGGCAQTGGSQGAFDASSEENGKLKVAVTLFPYYDFVRQVAGDQVELSLVIPAGMDSHSFEPTPRDIRTMQEADVIIANGGAMEHWVDQVVDSFDREDQTVVIMMDHVDAVEEEIVEGMEHSDEGHGHVHVHEDGEEDGHLEEDESQYEIEYDEHIWTSPVNAMKLVDVIGDTLAEADPAHADTYHQGAENYKKELEEIDSGFREVSANRKRNMIVMGDKFPFRYLADEYQLDYRAAFSGCSSDTEPSAKTIAYLIDKVKEEQIPAVYYLELSSHRVAEIIGEETGAEPLLLHSCHNVTRAQFDTGITYAGLMRQNIENLRKGID